MGWSPPHHRPRRRPRPARLLEALEDRQLLASAFANASYDDALDAEAVRSTYGVDGSGLVAAVIDTGVDYHHAALGGSFGSAAPVVRAGHDFGNGDPDPDSGEWYHGTTVAGLIAGRDPQAAGVAPGAGIAALRVFDEANQSNYGKVADALQWVLDHADEHDITVVNLSLSDDRNYVVDYFSDDGAIGQRIAGLVGRLRERGILVVSAAGNRFNGGQGMGFTAILPGTLSVTGLESGETTLLSYAQRLGAPLGAESATDLAVQGQGLRAPSASGGSGLVEGTSFAAPLVSGAILLLQQIYQGRFDTLPTADQVESWLKSSAAPFQDPATGTTQYRLDLAAAAALVPRPEPAPTPPPAPVPIAMPIASASFAMVPVSPEPAVRVQRPPSNHRPQDASPEPRRDETVPGSRSIPADTRAGRSSVAEEPARGKGLLSRLLGALANLNIWTSRKAS